MPELPRSCPNLPRGRAVFGLNCGIFPPKYLGRLNRAAELELSALGACAGWYATKSRLPNGK